VGLFVNEERAAIERILREVPLGLLQFHGDEPAEACEDFGRPWIKAIRMRPDTDLQAQAQQYAGASGLLLDTFQAGVPGGTGQVFDWSLIPMDLRRRIVLAGGLDSDNVTTAVRTIRPYAVDVSGGVEAAKGIKDPIKIEAFIAGVKRGDNS
jgi:phosphoribosylanthranilate isomerase